MYDEVRGVDIAEMRPHLQRGCLRHAHAPPPADVIFRRVRRRREVAYDNI